MSNPDPKRPAKSDTPKVFDVMRPGKAQASASGRPLITGHKPQVHDSTLTDKPQDVADGPAAASLSSHKKQRIEPTTAPPLPDAKHEASAAAEDASTIPATSDTTTPTSADAAVPTPEPTTAPTPPTPQPTEAEPTEPTEPKEDEPTDNVLMAPVEPLDTPEPQPALAPAAAPTTPVSTPEDNTVHPPSSAPETPKTKPAPSSTATPSAPHVVDKSKIVVSHHGRGKGQRKWGKKLLILFIVLLLAAATAYVLYDAGIIKTNLKLPHTGFFDKKNKDNSKDNKTSDTNNTSNNNASNSTDNSQQNAALTGYSAYKNQNLGFTFAYPKEWGSLTESTPASDNVVLAAATADTTGKNGAEISGKVQLTVSKKEGYQVVAAKAGPTVQPNNQGGTYTWKVTAIEPGDTTHKVGDAYPVPIARKAGSLTVFDFTNHDNSCTQARWVFEANGGYVELTAPSLCPKTPGGTVSAQSQTDYKAITENLLNSIATL